MGIDTKILILTAQLTTRLKSSVCLVAKSSDNFGSITVAIARPNKPLIVRRMHYEEFTQTVEKIANNCGQEHLGESSGIAQCKYVAINDETSVFGEAEILASAVLTELKLGQDAIKMAKRIKIVCAEVTLVS